jgi:hypothetical protein
VENLAGWENRRARSITNTGLFPPRPRFRERLGKNIKALSLVPREQRFYDLFEKQASILVNADALGGYGPR